MFYAINACIQRLRADYNLFEVTDLFWSLEVTRKRRDLGRLGRCFQLMEADDITLFQRWIADWQDVVEFEVVPVVEGKTTREALMP